MKFFPLLSFLLFSLVGFAQVPVIQWAKCLGGSAADAPNQIIQTSTGGYVIAGYSASADGDVTGHHGGYDYWIVKLSSSGNLIWQKSLGGTNSEQARSIVECNDGGYAIAGTSSSNDGDVTGNHGQSDYWIVKLSPNGNLVWQKSFGGSNEDYASSIINTIDGGFLVAGSTASNDGDVISNNGSYDIWLVKLNANGNLQWQKTIGSNHVESAKEIYRSQNGRYLLAYDSLGYPWSYSARGKVIKMDSLGNIEWKKGVAAGIRPWDIQETLDGELCLASTDWGNICNYYYYGGQTYIMISKSDTSENFAWGEMMGGKLENTAEDILQTSDLGFIVAGGTRFTACNVDTNYGELDYWLIKLRCDGEVLWQKSLGGSDDDNASTIVQSVDGGFVVAGSTLSNDVNVTGNHGGYDFWIVKLSSGVVCLAPDSIYVSNITSFSAKLHWTVEDCAFGYRIQYRPVGSPTWVSKNQNNNVGQKNIIGLLPNTTYQWRVRTKCSNDPLQYSTNTTIQTFTTLMRLSDVEEEPITFSFFPNPFTNSATISINLEGNFDFILSDVFGREVFKSQILNSKSQIERGNLSSGIYFYRIMEEGKMIGSGKVVIE